MPSPASSSGTPSRMPLRSVAVGQLDRLGKAEAGAVARIRADHRAEQQRAVGDVARERAGLVERGRERDHPVAADRAVRRLHPDDPAQRGGLADRAAGVGPDRPRRGARGDRARGAAARAAGDALGVPRVERRAVGRVLGGGAHRELVLVGLAEQRAAGLRRCCSTRRRRVRRAVVLEDLRAGLARDALGAEQVLDRDRDAGERAAVARRRLVGDPDVRVERVVGRALAVELEVLAGVEVAGRDARQRPALAVSSIMTLPGTGRGSRPERRVRRALERPLDRHRRARLVLAQGVLDVDHVRGRRDVGHVAELADQLDVVEHLRELAAEALDLLGRQLEAGEAGDVEDLIAAQHRAVMLGSRTARDVRRRGAGRRLVAQRQPGCRPRRSARPRAQPGAEPREIVSVGGDCSSIG